MPLFTPDDGSRSPLPADAGGAAEALAGLDGAILDLTQTAERGRESLGLTARDLAGLQNAMESLRRTVEWSGAGGRGSGRASASAPAGPASPLYDTTSSALLQAINALGAQFRGYSPGGAAPGGSAPLATTAPVNILSGNVTLRANIVQVQQVGQSAAAAHSHYYASGGLASSHPGRPRGTDTIPAWLSAGEYVVNAQSSAANRTLLERINSARGPIYREAGGGVPASPYHVSVAPGADKLAQKLLGRMPSEEELAAIACAPPGASVRVRAKGGHLYVSGESRDAEGNLAYTATRDLHKSGLFGLGPTVIKNEAITLRGAAKGQGIDVFSRQVEALAALGVQKIVAGAAGTSDGRLTEEQYAALPEGLRAGLQGSRMVRDLRQLAGGREFERSYNRGVAGQEGATPINISAGGNGYYTWPRFGYSGRMTEEQVRKLPEAIRAALGGKRDVRDLMDIPGGADAWQDFGSGLPVSFDLREGSRSRQAMEEYRRGKGKHLADGGSADDDWLDLGVRDSGYSWRVDDPPGTPAEYARRQAQEEWLDLGIGATGAGRGAPPMPTGPGARPTMRGGPPSGAWAPPGTDSGLMLAGGGPVDRRLHAIREIASRDNAIYGRTVHTLERPKTPAYDSPHLNAVEEDVRRLLQEAGRGVATSFFSNKAASSVLFWRGSQASAASASVKPTGEIVVSRGDRRGKVIPEDLGAADRENLIRQALGLKRGASAHAPSGEEPHLAGGGGVDSGPRGTDTIPAWLSRGEYVVNAQSAQANRGLLERVNAARGAVHLAGGGGVGGGLGNDPGDVPAFDTRSPARTQAPPAATAGGQDAPDLYASILAARAAAKQPAGPFPMAQRETSAELSELERMVELEKQRAKYAGSDEGKKALAERARLTRELQGLERRREGESPEARERAGKQAGQAFGSVAGNVYQQGSAGIMGLVAAADPFSTFPTFTESVKGLSIELGSSGLLGVVDQLSSGIQGLTSWLEGLDEGVKKGVGTTAAYAVGLAGITFAAYKAGAGMMALYKAMTLANAMALLPTLGTVALGMAGLAAGVGLAAGAYYLLAKNAKDAGGAMGEAGGAAGPGGPGGKADHHLTEKDYEGLNEATRKRLTTAAGKGDDSFRESLGEGASEASKRLDKLRAESGRESALEIDKRKKADEIVERARSRVDSETAKLPRPLNLGGGIDPNRDAAIKKIQRDAINDARKEMQAAGVGHIEDRDMEEVIRGRRLNLGGGIDPDRRKGKVQLPEEIARNRALQAAEGENRIFQELMRKSGVGGEGGPDRAYANLPQPAILDPYELGNKIQLAVANSNDLSARNLEKTLKNLEKNGGLLEDIVDRLNRLITVNDRNY